MTITHVKKYEIFIF